MARGNVNGLQSFLPGRRLGRIQPGWLGTGWAWAGWAQRARRGSAGPRNGAAGAGLEQKRVRHPAGCWGARAAAGGAEGEKKGGGRGTRRGGGGNSLRGPGPSSGKSRGGLVLQLGSAPPPLLCRGPSPRWGRPGDTATATVPCPQPPSQSCPGAVPEQGTRTARPAGLPAAGGGGFGGALAAGRGCQMHWIAGLTWEIASLPR